MPPRAYRLGKRAASREETRLRLVEATLALHREKGIAATSLRDIAIRADVGIGTAYDHFPTYEDALRACGERSLVLTRPPTPEVFAGIPSAQGRLQVLIRAIFGYYERYSWWERGRCDADKFPLLAEGVRRRQHHLDELIREALRPDYDDEQLDRTVTALTDFAVFRSLTSGGMSTEAAAGQVAEVIVTWLKGRRTEKEVRRKARRDKHSA
jgi:AcrR family transcriptional regulator